MRVNDPNDMNLIRQIEFLLRITRSQGIARRYFVTNGFDGALTMLGLCMGFRISGDVDLRIAIGACLGAAIALAVSGVTSAYISEVAERQRALTELENAMIADLGDSAHGAAARVVPYLIASVNGLAPLIISIMVITPLWLARYGVHLPLPPFETAILVALGVIFLLGAFLGRVSGTHWFCSGMRTLAIGLVTAVLIFLLRL